MCIKDENAPAKESSDDVAQAQDDDPSVVKLTPDSNFNFVVIHTGASSGGASENVFITMPVTNSFSQLASTIISEFRINSWFTLHHHKPGQGPVEIPLRYVNEKSLMELGFDGSHDNRNRIEVHTTSSKNAPREMGTTTRLCDLSHLLTMKPVSSELKTSRSEQTTLSTMTSRNDTGYVGLVNQAMTCYLNSLLQTLFMTPEFRNALYRWEFKGSEEEASKSIPYQLQRLFLQLQTTRRSAVETTDLTQSFGWDSSEAWQQHDIQELCRVMFDALEQCFKNTDQADLINNLYEGKMKDYVKCLVCSKENAREDTFLDVPLPIRPFGSTTAYNSLEAALQAFVAPELLTDNNKYECSKCSTLCDAHKGLKFTRFPYLMTCHLKRFDFDYGTLNRIKLNDKVTFPTILDLNSFVRESTPETSKSEAGVATPETGLVTPDKPDDASTTDSGSALDAEDNSLLDMASSAIATDIDTQDEDEGIDVSNSFGEKGKPVSTGPYVYELFSIMIHSGSASGGHYYVHIKDFDSDEWFCFNDQNVTRITFDDIRRTYGGISSHGYYSSSSANAYMLMYRQRDKERNAKFFSTENFPAHIKDLVQRLQNEEEAAREAREQEKHTCKIKLYYKDSATGIHPVKLLKVHADCTLKETTQLALEVMNVNTIPLERCRLVRYDNLTDTIESSFTESPDERISECLGGLKSSYKFSLLLETRGPDQKFENLLPGGAVLKVSRVHLDTGEVDTAQVLRVTYDMTVREFKELLASQYECDPLKISLVYEYLWKPIINDDRTLKEESLGLSDKIYLETTGNDGVGYKPDSRMSKIIERYENTITIICRLPQINDEILEDLKISKYDPDAMKADRTPMTPTDTVIPAVSTVTTPRALSSGACTTVTASVSTIVTPSITHVSEVPSKTSLPTKSTPSMGPMSSSLNAILSTPVISGAIQSPVVANINLSDEDEGIVDSDPTLSTVNSDQSASEDSSLTSDSDRTLVGEPADQNLDSWNRSPDCHNSSSPEESINKDKEVLSFVYDLHEATAALKDEASDTEEQTPNPPPVKYYIKGVHCGSHLEIRVDQRISMGQLKEEIEKLIGVSREHFKLFALFSQKQEYECSKDRETLNTYSDNTTMQVRLCRALLPGEFKGKVYTIDFESPDEPAKFLQDFVITQGQTVYQVKEALVKQINAKTDMNLEASGVRLRKKRWRNPVTIYLDEQVFNEDIPLQSNWEMYLQILDKPEIKKSETDLCLFAKRWRPSSYTTDPLVEFIVSTPTGECLKQQLSCLSGVPADDIQFAKGMSSFPCDISVINIEHLNWCEATGDLDQQSIFIFDDGYVVYYKDKTEPVKNLTLPEWSQLHVSENARLNIDMPYVAPASSSRYKEKGLKIYLNQS